MPQVLHLASPPPPSPSAATASQAQAPRTPAQVKAETVLASKPAGLLPNHLRTDLRTTGPRSRGDRTHMGEARHLRSEVGNVIFGIPSSDAAASPRPRTSTTSDSYTPPRDKRNQVFGEQPQARPTRARSHLSMSHKHTRSTADSIISNRECPARYPTWTPPWSRCATASSPGGPRANPLPKWIGTTTRRGGTSTMATSS